MSGQVTERPDEVIEHGPVTLDMDVPAGSGVGVVWRLTR